MGNAASESGKTGPLDIGKAIMPVEGFAYEVYGLCRQDDCDAVRLLEGAARWYANHAERQGYGQSVPGEP